MKLRIISPFLSYSGYGRHARWLLKSLVQCQRQNPEGLELSFSASEKPQMKCPEILKPFFGECQWTKEESYINVMLTIPLFWNSLWDTKAERNVGYCTFEGDRLNNEWVNACNSVDAVLVCTCKDARVFEASGVKKPVFLAPMGVDKGMFHRSYPPLFQFKEEKFTFLWIGDWHSAKRKGIDYLLESFLSMNDPKTRLILKTTNKAESVAYVRAVIQAKRMRTWPEIIVLDKNLEDSKIHNLYALADCIVQPFRAEGTCLPVLEGLVAGKKVIAPMLDGVMDYAMCIGQEAVQNLYPIRVLQDCIESEGDHYSASMWRMLSMIEGDVFSVQGQMERVVREGKYDCKSSPLPEILEQRMNSEKWIGNFLEPLRPYRDRVEVDSMYPRESPTDFLVVTYGNPKAFQKTLETLEQNLRQVTSHHLWVWDNTEDVREQTKIREIVEELRIECTLFQDECPPRNIGYAKAMNTLLKASFPKSKDYVCFLNPDLIFLDNKDWLATLQQYLKDQETANLGAVSPMLLYPDSGAVQFAGGWISSDYEYGENTIQKSGHIGWKELHYKHTAPRYCDFLTFACCLFRREVLGDVGLLDEKFFLGNEDVMYAVKMRERGYTLACLPSVKVLHHEHGTMSEETRKKVWDGWLNDDGGLFTLEDQRKFQSKIRELETNVEEASIRG